MKIDPFLKKAPFLLFAIFLPLAIGFFLLSRETLKTVTSPSEEIPKLAWLRTAGRAIVNEKGEQVILRGVNMASIDWGYESWHPKAVEHLAQEWQVNVIRVRIVQEDFERNERTFFKRLEKEFLIPARANGVYIILHPRVKDSTTDLPDQQTLAMWQAVAEKYKDDPTVLYDLLAEPHNTSRQLVVNAYHELIGKVRSVHPQSLIFVTGLNWGREINPYLKDPLPYDNLVYRSNPYNKPNQFESLFGEIAQVYPVFLGEFGAGGYPSMSYEDVQALLDYAQSLGIGWAPWNFHSVGCPCLLKNYQSFEPSDYGLIIKQALSQ